MSLQNIEFLNKKKNTEISIEEPNQFLKMSYSSLKETNQGTCGLQRPIISETHWVTSSSNLLDNGATVNGNLAIGKNVIVAYLPWEGYNFEDAVLISNQLVSHDCYTSLHIENYIVEIEDPDLGFEFITKDIPFLSMIEIDHLKNLDSKGIIQKGIWVKEGDFLVGKVKSKHAFKINPNILLQKDKNYEFIDDQNNLSENEMNFLDNENIFLDNENTFLDDENIFLNNENILLDDENNFLDDEKYEPNQHNKKNINDFIDSNRINNNFYNPKKKQEYTDTSFRVPKGVEGLILDVEILTSATRGRKNFIDFTDDWFEDDWLDDWMEIFSEEDNSIKQSLERKEPVKNLIVGVKITLLQRRKIQVGDKVAGRHGNKGIISKILPVEDMPYLPDGTPVDVVLNPLGIPSRMNVGQVLECLLGLAGKYLCESYNINLFDEKFGKHASRSFVYAKLYEASIKTKNPWLFELEHPGKFQIFDGRTGLVFNQPVTVGYTYMLKLIHMVDDKIHARATGPYSIITQQPTHGRAQNGGQRVGEMEVWAFQAYGAAFTLQELLTIKSDDTIGRNEATTNIVLNKPIERRHPESLKLILREIQSLCFNLEMYAPSYNKEINKFSLIDLNDLDNDIL